MGINPGRNEGDVDTRPINLNESDVFEYKAEKKDYMLANQIKKIFREADLENILFEEAIKTNYYHLITDNQRLIKYRLNRVEKGLFNQYEIDCAAINAKLIEILQPSILFCEGKSVYQKMKHLLGIGDESEWNKSSGFTTYNDRAITLIGCTRIRSISIDKSDVSALLNRFV
jgi:hypothetical protein